jgi:hypothetical protein
MHGDTTPPTYNNAGTGFSSRNISDVPGQSRDTPCCRPPRTCRNQLLVQAVSFLPAEVLHPAMDRPGT